MPGQLRLAENLRTVRIDCGKGATSKTDVDPLGRGVVPHVIRVITQLDRRPRPEIARVQELESLALSVRNSDQPGIRDGRDALRFAKAGQTPDVSVSFHVE